MEPWLIAVIIAAAFIVIVFFLQLCSCPFMDSGKSGGS